MMQNRYYLPGTKVACDAYRLSFIVIIEMTITEITTYCQQRWKETPITVDIVGIVGVCIAKCRANTSSDVISCKPLFRI